MIVFGVALALRLATVLSLPDEPYAQGGDATRYLSIARDILDGRSYGATSGDTTRVPLYQAFLALHLWIVGETLFVVAISQAFVGAATATVLTLTARELGAGQRAWIAGLFWAIYPPSILNTVVIFTQTLQVFWLSTAFWMLFAGLRRRSTTRCAGAAVLWGLACLTRAGNLFFLPVLAAAPLIAWRRGDASWRWRLGVAIVMFVAGAASVVWWTGREFPTTYRLEYLVTLPHERQALAIVLRPFEPLHAGVSERLQRWRSGPAFGRPAMTSAPLAVVPPRPVSPVRSEITGVWQREVARAGPKLWQTFHSPDGLVQMHCRGPAGGYWALFSREVSRNPVGTFQAALGSSCLALKAGLYAWHYLVLTLALPGFILLVRRWPSMALLLALYAGYTVAIVVLGSNYGNEIAAVPRFAFSFMPIPVLLGGLALARIADWMGDVLRVGDRAIMESRA